MFRVPQFTEAKKVEAAQVFLYPVGRQELCTSAQWLGERLFQQRLQGGP